MACPGTARLQHSSPHVLILNSYHYGEDWSDAELAGILEMFHKTYPHFRPEIEFLDSKRYPAFKYPGYHNWVKRFLGEKYAGHRHDLIMVLDNPAFEFLLKWRQELFPGIPVVFAGVNGFSPAMLGGQEKITGVVQVHDLRGTLQLALALHPETKQVFIIHDYTASGLALRREMEALQEEVSGRVALVYSPEVSWPELEKQLGDLPPHSLGLILTYVTDAAGRVFSREESTRLITRTAAVPVYALHENLLGYGIVGGLLLSGKRHGAEAAELALRILQGVEPADLPVKISVSQPCFDYAQLHRFGIAAERLPPGSVVINRPLSFYEQHKKPLAASGAIIAILISLSLGLAVVIFRLKRSEHRLRESEETYRTLFTTMAQGVVYQDADGHIISCNPAAEAILGLTREEMLGRTSEDPRWQALKADGSPFPGEEHPAMVALRTGAELRQIIMGVFNPREQGYRWISINAMPQFRSGEDRPYQVYTIFEDITAKRQADEALRQGKQVLEVVRQIQTQYIMGTEAGRVYQEFLGQVTELTGSGLGFLDEILPPVEGMPVKVSLACWPEGRSEALTGLDEALWWCYLRSHGHPSEVSVREGRNRVVIINESEEIRPRGCQATPPAEIHSFMGLPVYFGKDLVGLVRLANRPGGYSHELVNLVEPFLGAVAAIITSERFKTREQKWMQTMAASERLLHSTINAVTESILVLSREGRVELINEHGARRLGHAPQEITGRPIYDFLPPELAAARRDKAAMVWATGQPLQFEDRRNGTFFRHFLYPVKDAEGRMVKLVVFASDITRSKEAEERLWASLQEKEVLLKEIHHRVKNNLQIITSLLVLQARYDRHKSLTEILQDCQNRIRSMALIHESLYKSENLAEINFRQYVEKLAGRILVSYSAEAKNIRATVWGDEVQLDVNQAVPCGLIANELIVNALKHAFQPGEAGEIAVKVAKQGGRHVLEVKDTGRGFPPGVMLEHPTTFGWLMIRNLTKQLGGELKVTGNGGTTVTIIF